MIQAIEQVLKNNQKILLILNRKGEGTKFSCADCGWIALCQKCGLPLIPQKSENVCNRCQATINFPESCPKCQSVNLRPFGVGTAKLSKFIRDYWPEKKIIRLEKEIDNNHLHQDWDILIATNYALKFNFPPLSLVAIIDADQGLNLPDFHAGEKTFQNLFKFLKIGKTGIVQTHLPENPIIRSLAQMDYESFFLGELAERKKSDFPPFSQLIRLLYKNESEEKCKEETKRIYQLLNQLITNHQSQLIIFGPSPAFIQKERGKFRWQIVLKTKRQLDKEIKRFLMLLGKGWIIDVDPVNLL